MPPAVVPAPTAPVIRSVSTGPSAPTARQARKPRLPRTSRPPRLRPPGPLARAVLRTLRCPRPAIRPPVSRRAPGRPARQSSTSRDTTSLTRTRRILSRPGRTALHTRRTPTADRKTTTRLTPTALPIPTRQGRTSRPTSMGSTSRARRCSARPGPRAAAGRKRPREPGPLARRRPRPDRRRRHRCRPHRRRRRGPGRLRRLRQGLPVRLGPGRADLGRICPARRRRTSQGRPEPLHRLSPGFPRRLRLGRQRRLRRARLRRLRLARRHPPCLPGPRGTPSHRGRPRCRCPVAPAGLTRLPLATCPRDLTGLRCRAHPPRRLPAGRAAGPRCHRPRPGQAFQPIRVRGGRTPPRHRMATVRLIPRTA